MGEGCQAVIWGGMDDLDLDALWKSYLGSQLTGHSAVGGTVTLKGPLRDPKQWTLNGDISDLALDVEYAKLHNQDPLRFTYAQQSLRIEQAHLVGEGTDVSGHGSISFAVTRDIDVTADGQIDLKLLDSIDSDLTATAAMSVTMT